VSACFVCEVNGVVRRTLHVEEESVCVRKVSEDETCQELVERLEKQEEVVLRVVVVVVVDVEVVVTWTKKLIKECLK